MGSIPGSERSPGGGHGNPHQCSCMENPMDRGACRLRSMGVAKSWTQLKRLSTHGPLGFLQVVFPVIVENGIGLIREESLGKRTIKFISKS